MALVFPPQYDLLNDLIEILNGTMYENKSRKMLLLPKPRNENVGKLCWYYSQEKGKTGNMYVCIEASYTFIDCFLRILQDRNAAFEFFYQNFQSGRICVKTLALNEEELKIKKEKCYVYFLQEFQLM